MSQIRSPREALPVIESIRKADEVTWAKIIKTISSEPKPTTLVGMAACLEKFKADVPELTQILHMALALRSVCEDTGRDPSLVVKSFLKSMKSQSEFVALSDNDISVLEQRIAQLLDAESPLAVLARAKNLMADNAHSFEGTRIITDIRPIFGKEPEDPPIAFTVLHSLKINYSQDFHPKEFFVVLDDSDLETLQKAIERAQKKVLGVTKALAPTNIEIVSANEEES